MRLISPSRWLFELMCRSPGRAGQAIGGVMLVLGLLVGGQAWPMLDPRFTPTYEPKAGHYYWNTPMSRGDRLWTAGQYLVVGLFVAGGGVVQLSTNRARARTVETGGPGGPSCGAGL